ncbi:hypothetical protein P7K49_033070 [Saguinus oedipus]|uniref:Nucleolar and coiled-body phosphoprotein 1 n=1 Tax=Saguinus oedipus TaxID=9490 RepID=A0ABQ9TQV6_SAGOE|nr:hypothetical protein P7K49_033070 [Saguinus oedipus]
MRGRAASSAPSGLPSTPQFQQSLCFSRAQLRGVSAGVGVAIVDANKESSKASKPHKVTKEHRERPRKDSESKSSSKELEREQAKSSKDSSRKLGEGRLPKEEKAPPPKAAFKEPKMALKETKLESTSPKGGPPPPPPPPPRASSKRPATADSPKPSAKKQKKSSSKGSRSAPSTSPRTSSSFSDKKPVKDKSSTRGEKVKAESEPREAKKALEVEESNSEDEASFKSEQPSARAQVLAAVVPVVGRCVSRRGQPGLELDPSANGVSGTLTIVWRVNGEGFGQPLAMRSNWACPAPFLGGEWGQEHPAHPHLSHTPVTCRCSHLAPPVSELGVKTPLREWPCHHEAAGLSHSPASGQSQRTTSDMT